MSITIKLLGTRGSSAVAGEQYLKYGGNTACVGVAHGDDLLLLDGGSGIVGAADWLAGRGYTGEYHILLTHYHLDHISGLGMFPPVTRANSVIHLYGPAVGECSCQQVLERIFAPPLWPLHLGELPATVHYHTVMAGVPLRVGDIEVLPEQLCHPGGALGYRVTAAGSSFCYMSDHEQECEQAPDRLLPWLSGASLVICDAPFTAKERPYCKGWGHSTVDSVVELARRAQVQRLLITHHSVSNTDSMLDAMQASCPDAEYCRAGMEVTL